MNEKKGGTSSTLFLSLFFFFCMFVCFSPRNLRVLHPRVEVRFSSLRLLSLSLSLFFLFKRICLRDSGSCTEDDIFLLSTSRLNQGRCLLFFSFFFFHVQCRRLVLQTSLFVFFFSFSFLMLIPFGTFSNCCCVALLMSER